MASFSTLPRDLIREILLRAPAESLVRSMLTCKQWNNLINDKKFIDKHLDRSPIKFLKTDETTVHIMDPVTRTRSATPMPNEFQPPDHIRAMFHCDGLMLCRCTDLITSKVDKLALWNPLTRKVSWVDEPSQPQFVTFDYYGIGYDNNKLQRDYKILKFSVRPNGEVVEVQIYECMSKSWRTLLYDTKVDWEVDLGSIGVAVKGNVYWLAKKEKTRNCILGFDFSDETFKDICFIHLPYNNNFLGCYDGDKLSLLEQNQEVASPIEVWVSSKLADGNVSFHQYFKVDNPSIPPLLFVRYYPHPIYCIAKDKLFIAYYEGDVHEGDNVSTSITLCEIDQGTGGISNELVLVRPFWDIFDPFGTVYVPSLVSLPV